MPEAHLEASAAGGLMPLARLLEARAGFADAVAELARGGTATFDGAWGSACALVAAALAEARPQQPGPLVVVLPTPAEIDAFADDLALFSPSPVTVFPAWETDPGEAALRDDSHGQRLRVLKELIWNSAATARGPRAGEAIAPGSGDSRPPLAAEVTASAPIYLTAIQALLQPVPARESLADRTRRLRVGETVDVQELSRWLAQNRFHSTSAVELPREFSVRGGILDLFAVDWLAPVRVEFFGDEVTSLRRFDVATQRSLEELTEIEITLLNTDDLGREQFTHYVPPAAWVLLVEPERIAAEGKHYLERVERVERFHSVAAVLKDVARLGHASAAALAPGAHGVRCPLGLESVERFGGDFQRVRADLDRIAGGHEVFIVVQTPAEVERLQEVFAPSDAATQGKLHFPLGRLRAGFRLVSEQVLLISGSELFHRGDLKRAPQRRLGKAIDSFLDLREGDLVVHLAHGIGRYRGLKLLTKETQVEEHLEIEFGGATKVYVPVAKIELVQKYVGGTKSRPVLAKLGGKGWLKQKEAAAGAVEDLAAELLEVQAMRASRPGIAFGADTEWQREFDQMFPYAETPDQLAAIAAIKGDMQRPRPMDRLLCGDVGYGKTEVAMRAAFKAIDHGYQVAVLVPTTILCEQHFRTFTERMAEFPCTVGKLSRFASPPEQRQTIAGLAAGSVDIVVGTHRLASADVQFANLGLVLIDEEQRFGVEVKERLKSLRATVDILTLTATPIPRTLHMSLTGLRDISNLETPPEDRIAVDTKVSRFDRELIRHAVLRELSRGGQIFFVHNRVNDIHAVQKLLGQIVPEASVRIGHGQMPEDELEEVMVDFVAGKFDLLLATTIVESGLDIPNANTIFINEADRYGLADLHQLRGRVGRYKHRAYCYLLIDANKHITPTAAKRLRAIEEFSEMGAGFAISMRDLELRGAGNVLGTQQSGHIAAVGYELYCQLLEHAVRQLQKLPQKLKLEVDVDLPGEAYLPREYVPDMRLKIDLYRRLSRIEGDEQLTQLRSDLVDRFGPLPEPVERMLSLAELKIDAAIWQIAAIRREDKYLVFSYTSRPRVEQWARATGGRVRVVDDKSVYLTIPQGVTSADDLIELAKSVLRAV